ncbi:hypothetical protein [Kitasatospora sp. NPDC087315]|uniref:hypothetical protein n=1 Tax=Kitasatospora sp. NPDC087315 TaxID=3364069 RepID=UPI0038084E4E
MAAAYLPLGSTRYHLDANCPALDTARLHNGGIVAEITPTTGYTPCLLCVDTAPTEWTVTTETIAELWELIGPAKYHTSINPDTGRVAIDGLTLLEHGNADRQFARFGDTIRFDRNGCYRVRPAAPST